MNSNLMKILAAAIGVSLVLAMAMGGMFAYLFFALALVLVILIVLYLVANPSASARTHTLPAREPVFEESRPFSELDPFSQNEGRKKLAQQLERRIQKGDHQLTAADLDRADAGDYELDRIGLYFWEEHTGQWPKERIVHVRHEFERIRNAGKPRSLMPLHYALRSFEKCLRQERSEPASDERQDVLEPILKYVIARPEIDQGDEVKDRVRSLLQNAPAAPATVSQAAPAAAQADYAKVRDQRYADLAAGREIKLRIESLQVFISLNDNGDAVLRERYEMVSSESSPISFIPAILETEYGFVPDVPRYTDKPDGQEIEWKFTNGAGNKRKADIVFHPPIGDQPISFTRYWTHFNAVYFNQRDRSDAGSPAATEDVVYPVKYRYDQLRIRVSFPRRIFPGDFTVQARRTAPDGSIVTDLEESDWAAQRLDWDENDSVVWVDIAHPLTGYSYHLLWNLPATDGDELRLPPEHFNQAEELAKRFVSLANQASPYRPAAVQAMQTLGADLENTFGGDIRLALYCYRQQSGEGGLIEVLERNGYKTSTKPVRIGRTLVGRSFRRKSALAYQSVLTHVADDKSFEPVPSEEGLAKPCAAVAVPLLCPEPGGIRAAVIYISTRTADSKLVEVWKPGDARVLFGRKVKHWYANEMCNALDMKGLLQSMAQKQTQ